MIFTELSFPSGPSYSLIFCLMITRMILEKQFSHNRSCADLLLLFTIMVRIHPTGSEYWQHDKVENYFFNFKIVFVYTCFSSRLTFFRI